MHAFASTAGGTRLRELRAARRFSQMELALRAGVSQRHLSCIETGRAHASREMLLALLEALDATLAERNDALLAAGDAPLYARRPLDAPERLASTVGELRFFTTFTTFGAPLDVTVASLRVEHLFPADAATRAALAN